jgi:hypothetical protein
VIHEYISGKQVTPAHTICNPGHVLCSLIGVEKYGAIGIMTVIPGEGTLHGDDHRQGEKHGADAAIGEEETLDVLHTLRPHAVERDTEKDEQVRDNDNKTLHF